MPVLTSQVSTHGLAHSTASSGECGEWPPGPSCTPSVGLARVKVREGGQDKAPTSEPLRPVPSLWASHLAGQSLVHTRTLPRGWPRASTLEGLHVRFLNFKIRVYCYFKMHF